MTRGDLGISLVDVLVAAAAISGLALLSGQVFTQVAVTSVAAQRKAAALDQGNLLTSALQKPEVCALNFKGANLEALKQIQKLTLPSGVILIEAVPENKKGGNWFKIGLESIPNQSPSPILANLVLTHGKTTGENKMVLSERRIPLLFEVVNGVISGCRAGVGVPQCQPGEVIRSVDNEFKCAAVSAMLPECSNGQYLTNLNKTVTYTSLPQTPTLSKNEICTLMGQTYNPTTNRCQGITGGGGTGGGGVTSLTCPGTVTCGIITSSDGKCHNFCSIPSGGKTCSFAGGTGTPSVSGGNLVCKASTGPRTSVNFSCDWDCK
jgi:hypothetical protein